MTLVVSRLNDVVASPVHDRSTAPTCRDCYGVAALVGAGLMPLNANGKPIPLLCVDYRSENRVHNRPRANRRKPRHRFGPKAK